MSAIIYRSLPIVAALILLFYLFFMLRDKNIQHKYVYLWSVLSLGVVILAIYPNLALKAASLLGFETAANLLLSIATFTLLLSSIAMSVDLSRRQRHEEDLTQNIALLEKRVRDLENSEDGTNDDSDGTSSV